MARVISTPPTLRDLPPLRRKSAQTKGTATASRYKIPTLSEDRLLSLEQAAKLLGGNFSLVAQELAEPGKTKAHQGWPADIY